MHLKCCGIFDDGLLMSLSVKEFCVWKSVSSRRSYGQKKALYIVFCGFLDSPCVVRRIIQRRVAAMPCCGSTATSRRYRRTNCAVSPTTNRSSRPPTRSDSSTSTTTVDSFLRPRSGAECCDQRVDVCLSACVCVNSVQFNIGLYSAVTVSHKGRICLSAASRKPHDQTLSKLFCACWLWP